MSVPEGVATTSVIALGLILAFDTNVVVHELGGVELRPHHALALLAGFAAAVTVIRGRVGSRSEVWTETQRNVLATVVVAQSGFLIAAYYSPLGAILHRRTLDVSTTFLIAVAVVVTARRPAVRVVIMWSIGIGVIVAAVIGIVAFATSTEVFLGDRYRGRVTLLGDDPRFTRPFSHANIAAMFFAPFSIGFLAVACSVAGRLRIAALAAATTLVALTAMTASRAGVVAVLIGSAALVWVLRGRTWRSVVMVVGVGLLVALAGSPAIRDRIAGSDRFAATVVGPPDLVMDGPTGVSVFVRNDSSQSWPATGPDRVVLTARWRGVDQSEEWLTHVWSLPHDLAPRGEFDIELEVPIDVPDGRYVVLWDLLLDREAFFLEANGQQSATTVDVVGSTAVLEGVDAAIARSQPSRPRIWGWALALFVERPWFGHGAAMMRFVVPEVAPDGRFIAASHAHNLVLEPLSAWGLVGSLPFLILVITLGVDLVRRLRRVNVHGLIVGLGLVVMLAHGLVEWPLMFPPLAGLFAILSGLWVHLRAEEMAS